MRNMALRAVTSEDLDILFDHQTDETANQMAAFGSKDPFDKLAFHSRWQRILSNPDITARTVIVDNHVCGYIAFFEQLGKPSISYWIGKSFWGRGIATDAVSQFMNIINVRPLFARVALNNVGSIKVLAKNGFKKVGEETSYSDALDTMVEEAIYSLEHRNDN